MERKAFEGEEEKCHQTEEQTCKYSGITALHGLVCRNVHKSCKLFHRGAADSIGGLLLLARLYSWVSGTCPLYVHAR